MAPEPRPHPLAPSSGGASTARASAQPPVLELVNIEKSFGGVRALRGARLKARRGEIVGLCGENGAGKSTLLKLLAGVYPHGSYTGDILLDGAVQRFTGPAQAQRAGIAVVYQELTLVPELTVAQNLLLGREPGRFGLVDDAKVEALAREHLSRFGFTDPIDVTRPVRELGIGLRQIVEIVRALPQNARILVLDEPTAALSPREAQRLRGWLLQLREQGTACIYVSHQLGELFDVCDRITVLRDGRTAADVAVSDTTPERVVHEMVGRPLPRRVHPAGEVAGAAKVLEVTDLGLRRAGRAGDGARPAVLSGVSFSLRRGEIAAVCGAMGSGRTALLSTLFGCARGVVTGRVAIDGAPVALDSPRRAIAHGIAFVPEDRQGAGLIAAMSVEQNLSLPSLASSDVMGPKARLGLVDREAERRLAERRIAALQIRGNASSAVSTLSGGNQQKTVLGKWLERPPKVLLLDEPTRGVDVGSREEIYEILTALARSGVAILLASSDYSEVLRLAARIFILRSGKGAGELDAASATQETIVSMCSAPLALDVGAPA